jgi:hypothetical protein
LHWSYKKWAHNLHVQVMERPSRSWWNNWLINSSKQLSWPMNKKNKCKKCWKYYIVSMEWISNYVAEAKCCINWTWNNWNRGILRHKISLTQVCWTMNLMHNSQTMIMHNITHKYHMRHSLAKNEQRVYQYHMILYFFANICINNWNQ